MGRSAIGGKRWEDNIEMDLIKIGFEDVDWIVLAEDCCECSNETSSSIKDEEFSDWLSVLWSCQGVCSVELLTAIPVNVHILISFGSNVNILYVYFSFN
jgi:hypothetical protein